MRYGTDSPWERHNDKGGPLSDTDSGQSERARAWLRRIYPTLPIRLCHVGPYQEAAARLSGQASPDLATRALNRLWIGRHTLAG